MKRPNPAGYAAGTPARWSSVAGRVTYAPPDGPKPALVGRETIVERLVNDQGSPITVSFQVLPSHAPALRSLLDDMRQHIGTLLESPHSYARELALTAAAIAAGSLAAAVNAKIPAGDPHYEG